MIGALFLARIAPRYAVVYTWVITYGWFRPAIVHGPPGYQVFGPLRTIGGHRTTYVILDEVAYEAANKRGDDDPAGQAEASA